MHTTPSRRTAAVTAALVLALLLGAVAPATGAALTHGAVKKIAAKVVKKSAPRLSVAHAATAGDAATLQGRSLASLQTAGYTYTLTPHSGFGVVAYGFAELPAGTYLATYDVSVGASTTLTGLGCYLQAGAGTVQLGYAEGRVGGSFGNCVGSAVVTSPGISFHATASQPLQIYDQPTIPSNVTFVRLDAVTPGAETLLP